MTRTTATILALLLAVTCLSKAEPLTPIPLWPDGNIPGEAEPDLPPEKIDLKGKYQIEIMSNVSVPTLAIYPAPDDKRNGAAVIVCPGGAYNILAYSHEGKEVCEWLNSLGITAGLLKYRVPRRKNLEKHDAPLQDAQRAISLMRTRAAEWKLDPKRIGICGFSAGGHLAAAALTSDGKRGYPIDPKIDSVSAIPDFGILVYPAYLQNKENPDQLAPEITVTDKTPPAFLVVSHGDKTFAEGSAHFYIAMKRRNRSAELHIFAKGGHGFGLKNTGELIKQWPHQAGEWMEAMGFLSGSTKTHE